MAIFVMKMKTFSRASGKRGSRATSGAAYRAGERIRDERTGATYDHSGRRDVLHKEIVLPSSLAGAGREMDWARDRSTLWNAAEHAEARRNARVAREFTVALPHELAPAARTALSRSFARELADRYGSAVDLVIHAPRTDPRNFHAHLLATTREVTAEGLGPKTTLELSGTERHRRGLARWADEIASVRERWASLTNEALREAHVEARVSHRAAEAGPRRGSSPWLPAAAYYMEKRGERSFLAERIRAAHRAREAGVPFDLFARLRAGAQSAWAAFRTRINHDTGAETVRGNAVAHSREAGPQRVRHPLPSVPERSSSAFVALEERARESVRRWLEHERADTGRLKNPTDQSLDQSLREYDRATDYDYEL